MKGSTSAGIGQARESLTPFLRRLKRPAQVGLVSLVGGGVAYSLWLALFLIANAADVGLFQAILWIAAPLVSATGFAAGAVAFKRRTGEAETRFSHLLPWSVIGCSLGAGATYWFGQMLIVFGMLFAGALSIVIREVMVAEDLSREHQRG